MSRIGGGKRKRRIAAKLDRLGGGRMGQVSIFTFSSWGSRESDAWESRFTFSSW